MLLGAKLFILKQTQRKEKAIMRNDVDRVNWLNNRNFRSLLDERGIVDSAEGNDQ